MVLLHNIRMLSCCCSWQSLSTFLFFYYWLTFLLCLCHCTNESNIIDKTHEKTLMARIINLFRMILMIHFIVHDDADACMCGFIPHTYRKSFTNFILLQLFSMFAILLLLLLLPESIPADLILLLDYNFHLIGYFHRSFCCCYFYMLDVRRKITVPYIIYI